MKRTDLSRQRNHGTWEINGFIRHTHLTLTDLWRGKDEGKNAIDDFSPSSDPQ